MEQDPAVEEMQMQTEPAPQEYERPSALDNPLSSDRFSASGREHRPSTDNSGKKRRLPGNMVPCKRPVVATQVQLMQEIITKLGDYTSMDDINDLANNIEMSANIISSSGHLQEFPEIADVFVKTFSQLSVQVPIIASLLTLIHGSAADFGEAVARKLEARLLLALGSNDTFVARLLLRTLACLASSGCVEVASFLGCLRLLLEVANRDSSDVHAKEEAAYLLASTILWLSPRSDDRSEVDAFLSEALPFLRGVLQTHICPFGIQGAAAVTKIAGTWEGTFHSLAVYEKDGAFDNLQEILTVVIGVLDQGDSSPSGVQPPFFPSPASASIALSSEWLTSLHIQLTTTACLGQQARKGSLSHWLRLRLPVLTCEASPEVQEAHQTLSFSSRAVALGYIQDILHFFEPVILEDGTRYGTLDVMAAHLLALSALFPETASTSIGCLLVEQFFHALLQPSPSPSFSSFSSASFSSVLALQAARMLLVLCKLKSNIAPLLAQAANLIYQLLPDLDFFTSQDFGRWFTYHYVNTNLSWPFWDFWLSLCEPVPGETEEEGESHLVLTFFLRGVTQRLGRLIGKEKIDGQAMGGVEVLPSVLQEDARFSYAGNWALFQGDASSEDCGLLREMQGVRELAVTLREKLQDRLPADDLLDWFDAKADAIVPSNLAAALLVHVSLFVVSENETLTAITALLDRYDLTIRSLADSPQAQEAILTTVQEIYGRTSPYMLTFVEDEMIRRGHVTVAALIDTLCPAMHANHLLAEPDAYHRVKICVDRCLDFVRAASHQLEGDMKQAIDWSGPMEESQAASLSASEWKVEAVKMAVRNARHVFHTLLAELLIALGRSEAGGDAPSVLTRWVASSLLSYTLRTFVAMEQQLSQQMEQDVVLTSRVRGGYQGPRTEDGGLQMVILLQQLQELEPALFHCWRSVF